MKLLKTLCQTYAPSGNEGLLKQYILDYVAREQHKWLCKPQVFSDPRLFQDSLVLVFGQPRTAVFAHLDSIGYTVRYNRELVRLGGVRAPHGTKLKGIDKNGELNCTLEIRKEIEENKASLHGTEQRSITKLFYKGKRELERGTELVYNSSFRMSSETVQTCYLDNRLGCWTALKLAETLKDGILVFSCWEEVMGGSVPYLIKFAYENYGVHQTLVSDITWRTEGVTLGGGTAISMRDRGIPRRSYIKKIMALAEESGARYQLEVEDEGSSDAKELQSSPYPIDWCFVGVPLDFVHSPDEIAHLSDIYANLKLYQYLMAKL
ncbi:MAG: aminopeptidase [Cytophagales bacterium]|nr:MAG: aminopeptidase [Cytophagales bacterium]TAF60647.1 MAG: aminopeptidase [Cytophagales bacterium]